MTQEREILIENIFRMLAQANEEQLRTIYTYILHLTK